MKNYAHCKENLFSRADLSGTTCKIEANILNLYIIAFPEGSHQLLIFSLRLYRGGHKWSGEYLEVQQKYFANISSSSSSMTFGTQAESPTPPYYFTIWRPFTLFLSLMMSPRSNVDHGGAFTIHLVDVMQYQYSIRSS